MSSRSTVSWAVAGLAAASSLAWGAGNAIARPVTLIDAMNLALAANADLLDARAARTLSLLSVEDAGERGGWKVLPGVGVQAGAGTPTALVGDLRLERRLPGAGWLSFAPQVRWGEGGEQRADVQVALTQPLLRGAGELSARRELDAAWYAERQAAGDLHRKRVEVLLAVAASYFDAVGQRERVRAAEQSVLRFQGHVEAAAARERAGIAAAADVYRARIQLGQVQDELTGARERLGRALDDLKLAAGASVEEEWEVEAVLAWEPPVIAEAEAVGTALARRVEVSQAAERIDEEERLARLARSDSLPDVTLQAAWVRTGESGSFGGVVDDATDTWWVNLASLRGGDPAAARREAVRRGLAVEGARRDYAARRGQIVREVRRELDGLARLEEKIAAQRRQIVEAEAQLELSKVRVRHGLGDNADLIEAEARLGRARAELTSATADGLLGSWRLRAAMGTLLVDGPEPPLGREIAE